jgi:hypothetical protein
VVAVRQTGQAGLQRHGNIGGAKIEHHDAEPAGAQKLFAGAGESANVWKTHDHERRQISAAASRVGRIEKLFRRSHPAHRLAALLRFAHQSEGDRQRRRSRGARYFHQPPGDLGEIPRRPGRSGTIFLCWRKGHK